MRQLMLDIVPRFFGSCMARFATLAEWGGRALYQGTQKRHFPSTSYKIPTRSRFGKITPPIRPNFFF